MITLLPTRIVTVHDAADIVKLTLLAVMFLLLACRSRAAKAGGVVVGLCAALVAVADLQFPLPLNARAVQLLQAGLWLLLGVGVWRLLHNLKRWRQLHRAL